MWVQKHEACSQCLFLVFSYLFLKCLAGQTCGPRVAQCFSPVFMFPKLLPGEAVMILPLYELKRQTAVFFVFFSSSLSHGLISLFCKGLVSRPKLTSLSCSPYCLLLAAWQYTARAWEETIQGLNGLFLSGRRTVCVGTSLISESDTETDRWAIRFIYLFFLSSFFFPECCCQHLH